MRNKSLAYHPLWGLLGLLLLASATLLTARPSDAADSDTTVNCYSGVLSDCRSSTKMSAKSSLPRRSSTPPVR